mgnify:CR=1 FL=1
MRPIYFLFGIAFSSSYTMGQSYPNHGREHATVTDSVISKAEEARYEFIRHIADKASSVIVDVRTPDEFKEGHIDKSMNIPLGDLVDSSYLLKDYKYIVVVCRSGKRSEKAKTILTLQGFTNVYDGGAWQNVDKSLKYNK